MLDSVKSVEFLTNGSQQLLVAHLKGADKHLVYSLESFRDYGFIFYGNQKFETKLLVDQPLRTQEFGLIASSLDLTGRMSGSLPHGGRVVSTRGVKNITLQYPA